VLGRVAPGYLPVLGHVALGPADSRFAEVGAAGVAR
jgi:hypothetical protein